MDIAPSSFYRTIVFLVVFLLAHTLFGQELFRKTEKGSFFVIEKDYPGSIDGYNLYVPDGYTGRHTGRPVIVFLQGGLGVGDEVSKILNWALPNLILEGSENEKVNAFIQEEFIVIMPHLEGGQFYNNVEAIKMIIDEVDKAHFIDGAKTYLTGLSRGGHGSWGLASRMPEYFAAVAPICGRGTGIESFENLSKIPIWISHNTEDGVVRYSGSESIVEELENNHGITFHKTNSLADVRSEAHSYIFTSTPSDSHDAWTEFYNNPDFYSWLLRHKK